MLHEHERRMADEVLGDLGGAQNAIGRAARLVGGIVGTEEERQRLRTIETELRATIVALRERLRGDV